MVVAAVKAFHAKQQRYPKNLQELVPDFLPEIPAAKYALMFNRFTYLASDKGQVLFYADLPPYGRPTFNFARNEWGYLD